MKAFPLETFADELSELMPHLMKEFARRQSNDLYRGRITLPQFILLSHLEKAGPQKMKDVARALKVTMAAATGSVARLVRAGYAARAYDARDRRIVCVKLTPKGAKVFSKISRQRRQTIIAIFSKISPAEREEYLRILKHILSILKANQERP